MTRGSENEFPRVILEEVANDGSATITPAADHQALFLGEDGDLHLKDSGGTVTTIGGGGGTVDIEDEGAAEGAADTIDFTGAGVSVSFSGGTATVDIPGGGGGATINDGGLKPGSVTDDFDAAISGWTAHNTGGSFTIASCKHQAVDGSHLRIGYHNQNGQIYKSLANADVTWTVGGLRAESGNFGLNNADMFGVAILDSSGNGVGIVFYNDAAAYLAEIASWGYSTFYSSISLYGHGDGISAVDRGIYTVKLTRATNTWSGSISVDGENWINFGATGSKTITVDRRAIGIWYNPANTYRGTIVAAYEDI